MTALWHADTQPNEFAFHHARTFARDLFSRFLTESTRPRCHLQKRRVGARRLTYLFVAVSQMVPRSEPCFEPVALFKTRTSSLSLSLIHERAPLLE